MVEPRQAKKVLIEERHLKRPAEAADEQPAEAGQSMETDESRKGKAKQKRKEVQPEVDSNQTQVHRQGNCSIHQVSLEMLREYTSGGRYDGRNDL